MKKLIVFMFSIVLLGSCETKRVNFNQGYMENDVFYFDGKPLNGIMFRTFEESGKLMLEANLKNGKPDGQLTHYYENGKVSIKEMYKNGKRDGLREFYQRRIGRNGSTYFLREKENYIDGELSGEYFLYEEDGSVEIEAYYENGQKTVIFQKYNIEPVEEVEAAK